MTTDQNRVRMRALLDQAHHKQAEAQHTHRAANAVHRDWVGQRRTPKYRTTRRRRG